LNLYVDTSVLLRVVLGERGRLREWSRSERWISSELVRLECLCTIDRARVQLRLADRAVSARRAAVLEHLRAFELVRLQAPVLERDRYPDLVLATHDEELAIAAEATGFDVVGVGGG
jgi:predicted nucleic acid-binding protein